jgi:glutamate N-acetyltransferase/amino-acid N-acetyltransferase
MSNHTSPFLPKSFPKLPAIQGVELGTGNTGIRYQGRDDVLLATFAEGTVAAGVFTQSSMPGAPVVWCQEILKKHEARALVVNAGISNVFTGKRGREIVNNTATATAKLLGCKKHQVWLASTGIIGVPFDDKKLTGTLPKLKLGADNWAAAAKSILTTDTFPKLATRQIKIGTTTVTLNGFIKGSGMIAPNMATMLGFMFTDANIEAKVLQKLLAEYTDQSFNCITVDSDTSTSDTILLFATRKAKHKAIIKAKDPQLKAFKTALREMMIELAQAVVKDGEGISKFISITVKGAASQNSARKIGLSIANSPLVKTAIAGEDANWGRIVAAIGKSGEKADRDKLSLWIGGVRIAHKGLIDPTYVEGPTAKYMKGNEIEIICDVGVGKGESTVWTCDLTHAYIDINADYRS